MKIPKNVKVAGWVYTIEPMTSDESRDTQLHGYCSNNRTAIRIDPSYGDKTAAATLLHEILHAICCRFSWSQNMDQEQTVEVFENGLVSVIVDNPRVIEWILEGVLE